MFYNKGNVISSSTYDENKLSWGAEFAVDGITSSPSSEVGYFRTEEEDYPWFQLELSKEETISNINVSLKFENLISMYAIEIRAGLIPLDPSFSGEITKNELCHRLSTQDNFKKHKIKCSNPILAKFITIQVMNESSILGIDEISYSDDTLDTSACIVEGIRNYSRTILDYFHGILEIALSLDIKHSFIIYQLQKNVMGQQSVAKTTFVLVLKEITCIAMALQVVAYGALMIVQRILIA